MSIILEQDNKYKDDGNNNNKDDGNNNNTIEVNELDAKRRSHFEKVRQGLAQAGEEGDNDKLIEFYNSNAVDYHKMSLLAQYDKLGCKALVTALTELLPDKDSRILDLAAGTGLAGKTLRTFEYNNIDALEPAEKLIALAKSENVYKNYIYEIMEPGEETSIENGTYDGICIMGAVLSGHVSLKCLPEMRRILKKGGVVAFTIADKYMKPPEYDEPTMEKLFQSYVDKGKCQKWDKRRGPYRYEEGCNIYRLVFN